MRLRNIRSTSVLAAALLAGGLFLAQPVQAKVHIGTYKGTVDLGYDLLGRFGTPETDLGGHDFTAVVTIDTGATGAQLYEPGASSVLYGSGVAGPVRIDVTIDGVTQHFGDFLSNDGRVDYPADFACSGCAAQSGWSQQGYAYDDGYYVGTTHYINYALAEFNVTDLTGLISGLDHDQTIDLTAADPINLAGAVVFRTGVEDTSSFSATYSEYLDGYLTPTSVSWRTIGGGGGHMGGVPEPASWALMILGFGAAGAALRRRCAGASSNTNLLEICQ